MPAANGTCGSFLPRLPFPPRATSQSGSTARHARSAATPRDVIGRLHEELVKAARHPDVIARVAPLAADIVASRPEEMQARINAERERFGRVIPDMKIKLD